MEMEMEMEMDIAKQTTKLKVLMLPWLAHGHVSPFIELAKELSKKNFHIYFCSTPVILDSIKHKINDSIELIELHLPAVDNLQPLPPHLHTTTGLPPSLLYTLMKAFQSCGPSLSLLLHDLKPNIVFYDMCGHWVPPLAATFNIPAIYFVVTGATSASFFLHQGKRRGEKFPFPDIFMRDCYVGKLAPDKNGSKDKESFLSFESFSSWFDLSYSIILVKACRVIEEKYIGYLTELTGKRVVTLGPLLDPNPTLNQDDMEQVKILQWLDKKKPFSTIFVSLGSEFYLGKEELEELAYGLELSNVNFVWVLRFPSGKKLSIEEALPKGFLERVGEKGFIVDGWAPQTQILAHKSVGGYVSHCGWGSTLEGMYFGVPIVAMPMQLEHPIIGRLVEEVGVGVEVLRSNDGKYRAAEVARVIKEVAVEESGVELRRKVREVSEKLRKEGEEAPNVVAQEIRRICEMNCACDLKKVELFE